MLLAWAPYFLLELPQEDKAADHDHQMERLICVHIDSVETKCSCENM